MYKTRNKTYEYLYCTPNKWAQTSKAKRKEKGYDGITKGLHWLFAIAIIYNTVTGYSLAWIHDHAIHDFISTFNVSLATVLCVLFPLRVIWMHLRKELPPIAGTSQVQHTAAKLAHSMLYIVITCVLVSGYLMIPDGYSFFWLFDIATPFPEGIATHYFFVIHRISCILLSALVILHIMAVIQHYLMHKVNIVSRML